ncbi:3-oxoacyl-ACP reductase FabG [Buchnera aphidicola]|uniref:3-oxoacyl-ACP reductase FabG n=1 Tax=Buchnera aphidicola TaxID=9 RepID=UPI0021C9B62D|nr:3-oxoacyl-ACP reductase FabG [Buchnera aphidicola]
MITGANKGIGYNIAKYFSRNGITVIGTSTSLQGVKKINKTLKNVGHGVILNINQTKKIKKTINYIYKKYGIIDILINNASIHSDNLLLKMLPKEWDNVIKTNLSSLFYLCKYVICNMMKQRYGRIITISSIIGTTGNIGQINYSTTKSGIIGFNKTLALEVAPFGITANVVSPGVIDTGMTKKLNSEQKKNFLSKIPLKRFGKAQDISNVVFFLSSHQASYITGQTIHVNGGMYFN